jgi:hypothetical protein
MSVEGLRGIEVITSELTEDGKPWLEFVYDGEGNNIQVEFDNDNAMHYYLDKINEFLRVEFIDPFGT